MKIMTTSIKSVCRAHTNFGHLFHATYAFELNAEKFPTIPSGLVWFSRSFVMNSDSREIKSKGMKELSGQVEYIIPWQCLYEQEQRIPTVNIHFFS